MFGIDGTYRDYPDCQDYPAEITQLPRLPSACSSIITPPRAPFQWLGKSARYQKGVCTQCMRTSLTLALLEYCTGSIFYCHRHLFFRDFFHLRPNRCHEVIVLENLPFAVTYILSITSYCFIFDISLICKRPGRTSSPGTIWHHLDVLIGWELFWCPRDFELLSVEFIEITVISGSLQLQMR